MRSKNQARLVFAFLAVAVAPAVSGCSSEEAEPEPSGKPKVAEPVTFDASEATKKELGVVAWGADGSNGEMKVSGYDAHGGVVAVVQQRTVMVDATHHYFETTLSGAENARMKLDATVGAFDDKGEFDLELRMSETTFEDSPRAQSFLDHLKEDMEGGGQPSTLLQGQSLHPSDENGGGQLVQQNCVQLLQSCGQALSRFGGPLLPCARLAQSGLIVARCALIGGAAGGLAGAALGGALCAVAGAARIGRQAFGCAAGAVDTYRNWDERTTNMSTSCRGARDSCMSNPGDLPPTTDPNVPIASFVR
jgi:hypothetical protein